jgi:hypothetical protein
MPAEQQKGGDNEISDVAGKIYRGDWELNGSAPVERA